VKVCRMEAYQDTIQVQRCVERRVPVTYTCTVPRVVCCRVPIDACGNPIGSCDGCGSVTDGSGCSSCDATAPYSSMDDGPTRAQPGTQGDDADVPPALDDSTPAPVDDTAPPSKAYSGQSTT